MEEFAPYSDPKVQAHQRATANASFKAFNAISNVLLKTLSTKYPGDFLITFFQKELDKLTSDKTKLKVPALNFFKEIRSITKFQDEAGNYLQYADLLANKDPRAMEEPIPIPILNATGIAKKFEAMPQADQDMVWDYLQRMVKTAVTGVLASESDIGTSNELGRAVVKAAMTGKKTVAEIASDPAVNKVAQQITTQIAK